ncbi:hypothetical protein KC335_g155 [Hortaea werneckii]|nr:hypothetical protein KC335_g155 [Hortaea werneckii]
MSATRHRTKASVSPNVFLGSLAAAPPPNLLCGKVSLRASSGLYSFRHFSALVSCSLALVKSPSLARRNF